MRHLVAVLACVAVTGPLPANALSSPRPTCHLVTDHRGDAGIGYFWPLPEPVQPAMLDILSADLATGRTTVTAVMRLRGVDADHPLLRAGASWTFLWRVDGTRYRARFDSAPSTSTVALERANEPVGTGEARIDPVRNTLSLVFARSLLPELADRRASKFADFFLTTGVLNDDYGYVGDVAASETAYVENRPSCVRPA